MPDPAAPEPGIHIVVGNEGRILRSAPIRNAPRRHLEPPYLRREILDKVDRPMKELVLDLLARDGRVLDSLGWPWIDDAFTERFPPGGGEKSRSGRVSIVPALRVLRIPVPQYTMFLLFSEAGVEFLPDRARSLTRRALSLYSLVEPVPPPPPLPDFARRLAVQRLPGPVSPARPH